MKRPTTGSKKKGNKSLTDMEVVVTNNSENVNEINKPESISPANKKFKCQVQSCNEAFTTHAGLKVHTGFNHMPRDFHCKFCNLKTFPNKKAYESHVETFHCEDEPLKCKKCQRVSKTIHSLWRHIRESHRSEKFQCEVCGFEFTRPENLKVHFQNYHEKDRPPKEEFGCKECDKKFKLKTTLRQHVKIRHRDSGSLYPCPICFKLFKMEKAMNRHIRWVHNLSKVFKCTTCEISFKSSAHLERHYASLQHKNAAAGENIQTEKKVRSRSSNRTGSKKPKMDSVVLEARTKLPRNSKSNAFVKMFKCLDKNPIDPDSVNDKKDIDFDLRTCETYYRKSRRRAPSYQVLISEYPEEVRINDCIKVEEPFLYVPTEVSDYTSGSENDYNDGIFTENEEDGKREDKADDSTFEEDVIDAGKPRSLAVESVEGSDGNDEKDKSKATSTYGDKIEESITINDDSSSDSDSGSEDTLERHHLLRKSLPESIPINKIKTESISSDEEEDEKPAKHFCIYCDEGFSSIKKVQRHEPECYKETRSRKFPVCPTCGKKCSSQHKLKLHMVRHVNDRPFKCTYCPATFKRPRTQLNHEDSFHKGKESHWQRQCRLNRDKDLTVRCEECGRTLANPKCHRRHVKEIHGKGDRYPYKCDRKGCNKKFKRPNYLNDHIHFDHEVKQSFKCKICKTSFNREYKLEDHFKRKRHLKKVALAKQGSKRKLRGTKATKVLGGVTENENLQQKLPSTKLEGSPVA